MAQTLNNLRALFDEQLKDAYSAESQILEALPKMRDAATDESLRQAFADHLDETREQAMRLQEVCAKLGITPTGHRCKAMAGIIAEGSEVLNDDKSDPNVRDAALICAAQKVEHYEMALYGCLCSYAESLNLHDVAETLEQTLEEEKATDLKLTELAEGRINAAAG
ncbi:MAG: DUF892 family protein [Planctomycetota bacterium]|nr:DUF892 family protein [Planctomycetota bacterium]